MKNRNRSQASSKDHAICRFVLWRTQNRKVVRKKNMFIYS